MPQTIPTNGLVTRFLGSDIASSNTGISDNQTFTSVTWSGQVFTRQENLSDPVYLTNALNGKPGFRSSGAVLYATDTSYLQSTLAPAVGASFCYWFVGQVLGNAFTTLYAKNSANDFASWLVTSVYGDNNQQDGRPRLWAQNGVPGDAPTISDSPHCVAVNITRTGSNTWQGQFYIDGIAGTPFNFTASAADAGQRFALGNVSSGGDFRGSGFKIADGGVYNMALSPANHSTLASYASAQYGTANNGSTSYQTVKDDNFQRTDSGPGSTASAPTQPVGGGWLDIRGDAWGIRNNTLLVINNATSNALAAPLLRPASENFVDGQVRIYVTGPGSGAPGMVARFDPADHSGVAGFVHNANTVYFDTPAGQQPGQAIGLQLNAAYISEWTWTQVDENLTQYSVKFYYQSAPTVQVGNTITFPDNTPALQNRSGRVGIGTFNEASVNRVVVSRYVAGGAISTPPTLSLVSASRTRIALTATAAQGGTGSLTYKLYVSTTAGQQGTLASDGSSGGVTTTGATSLTPAQSGLAPGTTYYYTLVATDGTQTVASPALTATTVKSRADGGHLIEFLGDSITDGVGSPSHPARIWAIEQLRSLGVSCEGVNDGKSGYTTSMLLGDVGETISKAQANDADTVSLMIGTNDVSATNADSHQYTPAEYKSRVRQLAGTLLATGTGINTVVLQDCIGRQGNSGTSQEQALVAQYNTALDDICTSDNAGGRILRGDRTMLTYANAHQDEFNDLHPPAIGHQRLGIAWGNALLTLFTTPTTTPTIAPDTAPLTTGGTVTVADTAIDAALEYRIGSGAWTAYTGAIPLTTPGQITVSARATRPGYPTSTLASRTYTVQSGSGTGTGTGTGTGSGTGSTSSGLTQAEHDALMRIDTRLATLTATVGGGVDSATPAALVGVPVWQVEMLSPANLSVTGGESIVVCLTGQAGPFRLLDNTAYPVQIALLPWGSEPTTETTWHDATRYPDGTARLDISDAFSLTAAMRYGVCVKVSSGSAAASLVCSRPLMIL